MRNEEHDIEIIERYFDNELTKQEIAGLQERLKTDPELKKLFDREKLLINTIRFNAANNNLQFLKKLESSLPQQGTRRFRNWYYYAAAACLTLFVLVGIYLPFSNETPQELYADYFVPYPNVFEPTLRSGAGQSARAEAFQAYENGDYGKAATLFAGLLKEKNDPGVLLLLGNSNLALGKTAEAKQNFYDLINQYDDLDIQAKWFLSLCYLRTGEVEQARELLNELGNTEVSYAGKAKELLKKVE